MAKKQAARDSRKKQVTKDSSRKSTASDGGRGFWPRWLAVAISMAVWVIVVTGVALVVYVLVSSSVAKRSTASVEKTANAKVKALDSHLTDAASALSTKLQTAVASPAAADTPTRIDSRISSAIKSSYTLVAWPIELGNQEEEVDVLGSAEETGNVGGRTRELFDWYIMDAGGEPFAGVGVVDTPGTAAGSPFQLKGKLGYAVVCTRLAMKQFGGMKVKVIPPPDPDQEDQEQPVPKEATELDVDPDSLANIESAFYTTDGLVPTIYVNLRDWEGYPAGQVVLSGPTTSLVARWTHWAGSYVLAILAALVVGIPLGFVLPTILVRSGLYVRERSA